MNQSTTGQRASSERLTKEQEAESRDQFFFLSFLFLGAARDDEMKVMWLRQSEYLWRRPPSQVMINDDDKDDDEGKKKRETYA